MEVILLEKMRNLGSLGEKVKVKPGYARNYLIPQGKAVTANERNKAIFEQRRADYEKRVTETHQQALLRQKEINNIPAITITAKASEEGKLFGSINTKDILESLTKLGIVVEKREINLPQGALRVLGEHEIFIDLGSDMTATVKINIVASS